MDRWGFVGFDRALNMAGSDSLPRVTNANAAR